MTKSSSSALNRLSLIQNHTISRNLTSDAIVKNYLSALASTIPNDSDSLKSRHTGSPYTPDYKVYLESDGNLSSFWHDVPLYHNPSLNNNNNNNNNNNEKVFNMIVEIPRFSNAKFEISKDQKFNPIIQDTKKGDLRFVKNLFPYHGYIHNYGALPQTWEIPYKLDSLTDLKGDNDPLDVCEIGSAIGKVGEIKPVKIIGSIALIDDGETDWKLIAIDIRDPIASKINNLKDVELNFPGLLSSTRIWFRDYKKPDGKDENKFALDGKFLEKEETLKVINECFEHWKLLFKEDLTLKRGMELTNSKLNKTKEFINLKDLKDLNIKGINDFKYEAPVAAKIDKSVDKWHFV